VVTPEGPGCNGCNGREASSRPGRGMVAAVGAAILVWVLMLAYASSPAWAAEDGACPQAPRGT
jgi:hypothetical protein